MFVKREDILGMQDQEGRLICSDCMTDQEWQEVSQSQIVTVDNVEKSDGVFFLDCDCAKTQL